MTDNEKELVNIIRNSKNPEETLAKAFELILDALIESEDSQKHYCALQPELVEIA